jgi:hypothetical protein
MTPLPEAVQRAVDDLLQTVRYLEHDCSPHAPEIPFTLDVDLRQLFEAVYGPYWEEK